MKTIYQFIIISAVLILITGCGECDDSSDCGSTGSCPCQQQICVGVIEGFGEGKRCVDPCSNIYEGSVCDPATCSCKIMCTDASQCRTDADCATGDPCTVSYCGSQCECSPPQPKNCDDGDECTEDSCQSSTGACMNIPIDTSTRGIGVRECTDIECGKCAERVGRKCKTKSNVQCSNDGDCFRGLVCTTSSCNSDCTCSPPQPVTPCNGNCPAGDKCTLPQGEAGVCGFDGMCHGPCYPQNDGDMCFVVEMSHVLTTTGCSYAHIMHWQCVRLIPPDCEESVTYWDEEDAHVYDNIEAGTSCSINVQVGACDGSGNCIPD